MNANPSSLVALRAGDIMTQMMNSLFGNGWQHFYHSGHGTTSGGFPAMLAQMFQVYNSFVAVAVVAVLGYSLAVAVASTAHEGIPLGKRYSSLWMPIRSVTGLAVTVPAPGLGGYSLMQAAILFCVHLSFMGANMLANVAGDTVAKYGMITPVVASNDGSAMAARIFRMTTCAAALNGPASLNGLGKREVALVQLAGVPSPPGGSPGFYYGYRYDQINASGQPTGVQGVCGALITFVPSSITGNGVVDPADPTQTQVAQQEMVALHQMLVDDVAPATQMVQHLYAGTAPPNSLAPNVPVPPPPQDPGMPAVNALDTSVHAWDTMIGKLPRIVTASSQAGKVGQRLQAFDAQLHYQGFGALGGWYFTLARANKDLENAISLRPEYAAPTGAPQRVSSAVGVYLNASGITSPSEMAMTANAGGILGTIIRHVNDVLLSPVDFLSRQLAGSDAGGSSDPIGTIQVFGNLLIDAAILALTAAYVFRETALGVAKSVTGGLVSKIPLLGTIAAAAGGPAKGLIKVGFLIVKSVAFSIVVLGAVCAFYLPLVPYIVWTVGLVTLMIFILESMVAAPLWAAAHAMPEGDGLAGEQAKQGYMLLIAVCLRPILMVFGFLSAFGIVSMSDYLVGLEFPRIIHSMMATTLSGLVAFLALTGILVYLLVAIAHHGYGLIHEIPDRALRWINAAAGQLGDEALGGDVKSNAKNTIMGGGANINTGIKQEGQEHAQSQRDAQHAQQQNAAKGGEEVIGATKDVQSTPAEPKNDNNLDK